MFSSFAFWLVLFYSPLSSLVSVTGSYIHSVGGVSLVSFCSTASILYRSVNVYDAALYIFMFQQETSIFRQRCVILEHHRLFYPPLELPVGDFVCILAQGRHRNGSIFQVLIYAISLLREKTGRESFQCTLTAQ